MSLESSLVRFIGRKKHRVANHIIKIRSCCVLFRAAVIPSIVFHIREASVYAESFEAKGRWEVKVS